ncbi:hypothetical protein BGZ82_003103 [Podila clonocystis]|nr:hypothetical protein BGZ82_003103 [Podila clonocystis]
MSSLPGTPFPPAKLTSTQDSRPGIPTEISTSFQDWDFEAPMATASSHIQDSPSDTPVPTLLSTSIQSLPHEMSALPSQLKFYQDIDAMITNLHIFACGLFTHVTPEALWRIVIMFKNDMIANYEVQCHSKTITLQDPNDDVHSAEYKAKKMEEKLNALKEAYYARKEADKKVKAQKETVGTSKSVATEPAKE